MIFCRDLVEMSVCKRCRTEAGGSYKGKKEAKNGADSNTMSNQELTPQINCTSSLILLMVIYMRE